MSDFAVLTASLEAAVSACSDAAAASAATASDEVLLGYQAGVAVSIRLAEMTSAILAAEIAHRSRRELGYAGLAQKKGTRTPEALIQKVTGVSAPTARRLVRVGTIAREVTAHDVDPSALIAEPWLTPALRAAQAGVISAEVVDAIRVGLGTPAEDVTTEALTNAVEILTIAAVGISLENITAAAREARDELDINGVALREEQRRDRRYLRLYPQPDGMTKLVGLLDPESAAIVTGVVDAATSPRRGGPRFISADDIARTEAVITDLRTTEQLAIDALVASLDAATRITGNHTAGSSILGTRKAEVRVLVTQHDLDRRAGIGYLAGQKATISLATVERIGCDPGYLPILFDDHGQGLNLARTQRLHNGRQRTVIATRDGGCIGPDCDQPASFTEVHHIIPYSHGGNTNIEDGVLLCRHHHMLLHNNGWEIRRTGHEYWFIPPPDIDPRQTPIPLHTKNPAIRHMLTNA